LGINFRSYPFLKSISFKKMNLPLKARFTKLKLIEVNPLGQLSAI
jgi:hypothetical protein